ncbi:MAG: DUF4199 domain-containing protein [Bacteroidales bacterium]|nr:DUF4199 domain-containing protein [Bacteroidales bacterium]
MEDNTLDQFDGSKPSSSKVALINGVYMGIALIVVSLILYLLGLNSESYAQYFSYVVMIVLTVVFVLQWRNKYNGGYISYSSAFGNGFLTILFGAIISAIYVYVFFAFIAPGELQVMLDTAEDGLYDRGMSEQEIEMAMKWTKMMMTEWMMPIWVVVGSAFWGAIISAILAIFLKKEQKAF